MTNTSDISSPRISGPECAKEAWSLIKSDYWLLFAITVVGLMISGATLYILGGAMLCGIFKCYLKKIDGQPVKFEDLFSGFNYFGPGLVVLLIAIIPSIIVYAIIYFPLIVAMIAGNSLGQSGIVGLFIAGGLIDLVAVIALVCFHTLLLFAFPLIVDRGLSPMAAVKTSSSAVWANLRGMAGLLGVNILLTLAGSLAFCFGIYFTVPVIIATTVVAYRKLFPAMDGAYSSPPPPHNYSDL